MFLRILVPIFQYSYIAYLSRMVSYYFQNKRIDVRASYLEMANKLVPVLTGNPRINWVWVWVWGIPDFSVGYEDRYGDVHISAI